MGVFWKRVRVISRKAIVMFGMAHPKAVSSLDVWYRTALRASWRNQVEMRRTLPHADPVGELTVFDGTGKRYRLIARVNYRTQKIFVRAILTHADYDKGWWKK